MDVDLEEGDMMVFYSDGVIEAINRLGELYQTERLLDALRLASPMLSAQELLDYIVEDITRFCGSVEQFDDITIVVLRYNGTELETG